MSGRLCSMQQREGVCGQGQWSESQLPCPLPGLSGEGLLFVLGLYTAVTSSHHGWAMAGGLAGGAGSAVLHETGAGGGHFPRVFPSAKTQEMEQRRAIGVFLLGRKRR